MIPVLLALLLIDTSSNARDMMQEDVQNAERLLLFLQQYTHRRSPSHDSDVRFAYSSLDLNGDRTKELIVHIMGRRLCGSGGCPTLVLEPEGESYKLITEITITRLPIRVFVSTSNGWRDISVRVKGGGVLKGYEAVLCFDGNTYPSNPTIAPAKRARGNAIAHTAIDYKSKLWRLYP